MIQKQWPTFYKTNVQYSAVFSKPLVDPKFDANKSMQSLLDDFDFTVDDIEEAIDDIGENSACGDDDIPAIVLKSAARPPLAHLYSLSGSTP